MAKIVAEALKKAIQMEEEGKQFYLKAAKEAKNLLVKRVFEQLAQEEDLHIKKINEVYHLLKEEKPLGWITSVGDSSRVQKVFQECLMEQAKGAQDEIQALHFALAREEESIKYYENLAAQTDNNKEKRFYLTLSREERDHYLTILDSIEYLTDPVGWLQVHEKTGLEG